MDDANHDQRPRASLRGKGREILLGQQPEDLVPETAQPDQPPAQTGPVDAASLALTPEETEALLDFSPDSPAYQTAPPVTPVEIQAAPDAEQDGEPDANWWANFEAPSLPMPVSAGEEWPAAPPLDDTATILEDNLPLAERSPDMIAQDDDVPYLAAPDVEELVPFAPEIWSDDLTHEPGGEMVTPPVAFERAQRLREHLAEEEHAGGVVFSEEAIKKTAVPGLSDPFEPVSSRTPSKELFEQTVGPDQGLLTMLVDDERIRKLALQIEALQEELANNVTNDRTAADEYQKELLRASGLLMASRANYDDARAVVYRVRTDMKRREKIEGDIVRYRPLLLNFFIGWGIALVVLFLLREMFTGITEAIGVEIFAALYYPMLFGIVGSLVSGYLTLERHTTKLRDFDPIHISWYLFNPLLGGVMGLLMFLLVSIANEDLLQRTASDAERAITYLLCVVAGMNQNNVLRQLNDLLDRFGRGGKR